MWDLITSTVLVIWIFFRDQIFRNQNRDFFPIPNFSETETETFFRKQIFRNRSSQFTNLEHITISESRLSRNRCSKSEQKLSFMTKPQLPNLQQTVANTILITNCRWDHFDWTNHSQEICCNLISTWLSKNACANTCGVKMGCVWGPKFNVCCWCSVVLCKQIGPHSVPQ